MTEPERRDPVVEAAQTLRRSPREREALSLAMNHITDGRGRALFEALLNEHRNQAVDESAAIAGMMSLLEAMMDVGAGVAAYLMARLYPIAGQRRLHATYNAIELWMSESGDVEVADVLVRLANEGVRPKLRARYLGWATRIREHHQ